MEGSHRPYGRGVPAASIEFPSVADEYKSRVTDLHARRKKNLGMGGAQRIAKQHEKGKLTVRERIDLLFDKGTFVELGLLAEQQPIRGIEPAPDGSPADGVITGHGEIDGRQVWVIAYDFTVMAGSMGAVGEQFKAARVRELALRYRKPIVWLLDSAGARIQEAAGSTFAGTGWLFADQVVMSGVIPQVAAMLGPCAAGTAYIPGLADFVPMVKGTSSMALGGARLVKAATGEDVTDHDMGGVLDSDAADKAARFIRMCDAFNVPLVYLMDVPGFMVGSQVEKEGIIRHGAKMLYATSEATVPKVTVVMRKAYGAGYYVMNGKGYQPDVIVAWPFAEISVMGPEGAVNIIFNKQVEASDNPAATRAQLVETIRAQINPYLAAGWAMIDDVIDPAETRRVIIKGIEQARDKKIDRPWRKHGNIPV